MSTQVAKLFVLLAAGPSTIVRTPFSLLKPISSYTIITENWQELKSKITLEMDDEAKRCWSAKVRCLCIYLMLCGKLISATVPQ